MKNIAYHIVSTVSKSNRGKSSINTTEILLKVALNTITSTQSENGKNRGKIDALNTLLHDCALACTGLHNPQLNLCLN
jgi:hypothetical protein